MRNIFYLLLLSWGILPARAASGPALLPAESPAPSLDFVVNKGQWPSDIRYAAAVPGGHLCLEPGGLRYIFLQPIEHPHLGPAAAAAKTAAPAALAPTPPATTDAVRGHQLRVRFVGAAHTALEPASPTAEVRNYLHGSDPTHWAHAVPSYRQVRYQAPWPGIGARFYENETQHLEYDFEVAAGADPSRIRLRYEGATHLSLSDDGQLHVGTTVGDLTELAPHAYQLDPATGERQPVACRYYLAPAAATVSFVLGHYDHRRPLLIDPTVVFSTYSGAKGSNWGFTATYDAAGNLYSGGIVLDDLTAVLSYPTTAGAFQTTFGGVIDIALIKYNPAANGAASRVWATYLGGNQADFPSSLVVNAQGELLLLGSTASTNYPTTAGAVQRRYGGGELAYPFGSLDDPYTVPGADLVVTRLTADGSTLAASTYLGGSGNDGLVAYQPASAVRQLPQNYGDALRGDILTDSQGNVYVASVSGSSDFPTTAGSFGPRYQGGTCDAVVCKLPPALNALTWSGYLGGAAADAAYSVQLDASGRVYVAGGTLSPTLPGTAGGLMPTAQGNVDGFVVRLAASGSTVQRATYLGTSSYDQAFFVQLGADGGVYLLGQTLGAWPVSAGVYSNANSRQFIQKLSPDLDKSLLSTVFGSGRSTIDISPTAFLVDQCDRVYACGWGGEVNQGVYRYRGYVNTNGYTHGMATTANAVRSTPDTPGAGSDFYLAQFDAGLTGLSYGTYYGNPHPGSEGDHVDGGTSRFDPRGVVYAAACTCFDRTGFPAPPGAYSYATVNGGVAQPGYDVPCNNAAFKLNFEPTVAAVGPSQTVCEDAPPVVLAGTPSGGTWAGPGVSGSAAGGFVFTPSALLFGPQQLTYTVPGATVACTVSARLTVVVSTRTPAVAAALPAVCANSGAQALTGGSPAGGTWSGPGVSGSAAGGYVFTPSAALVGLQTLTYTLPASLSCANQASQATATVQVLPVPTVVLPADTVLCPGSTRSFRLRATPAGGTWSGPGLSDGNLFTPPTAPSTLTLTYVVGAGLACPASQTRTITLLAEPTLAPQARPVACGADSLGVALVPYTVQFSQASAGLPPSAIATWDFGDGTEPASGASVQHTYRVAGTFQPRLVVGFGQGTCSSAVGLPPIVVEAMLIPNIITPNGDTRNELFVPRLGGCPPRLQVFSRWGRQVYDAAAYRGTWGGAGLPDGIYYYLLTPPDGSAALKGWVEIVR